MLVEVPDELEKRFRMKVLEIHGSKKGSLSEAVREALEMWLERKK